MASIITAFFFLLIMFIGHEKPLNYKRGKLKTFGAWLLVALSLADMALAVCIALKVQSTYNELDYTFEFFQEVCTIIHSYVWMGCVYFQKWTSTLEEVEKGSKVYTLFLVKFYATWFFKF